MNKNKENGVVYSKSGRNFEIVSGLKIIFDISDKCRLILWKIVCFNKLF